MARRRRTSLIEDLVGFASRQPWWVSLLIAVGSWLILHPIANSQPNIPKDLHQMGQSVAGQLIRTFAFFGQFVLPAIFVIGAIGSAVARAERKKLHANVANARQSGQTIEGISWREFELLVGETFRRKGFTVIETGGSGPDGGVDLILHLGTDKYLVQCKQWKAINVGVTVIREFFGVMTAEGAAGGFVVTSGKFTSEARLFAEGRNIQLVDGVLLKRWMLNKPKISPCSSLNTEAENSLPPLCPQCNQLMVVRTARRGPSSGDSFWGCSRFPKCRGVREILESSGCCVSRNFLACYLFECALEWRLNLLENNCMHVQYYKDLSPDDFDPPVMAKVHLILVDAGEISGSIQELIDVISDQTWIESLDVIPRASFERTALRTIAHLVAQFHAADNKLNSSIGEYLVSISAAKGMESSCGHRVFPISELWKEKISNNHGFDFHTESPFEIVSFGEAKYNSNSNPYDDAATQVLRFLEDGKHLGDAVCLQYFVSQNSMENLVHQGVRGTAIAFSLSAVSPLNVLANCLDNESVVKLAGLCDELYVVGVLLCIRQCFYPRTPVTSWKVSFRRSALRGP